MNQDTSSKKWWQTLPAIIGGIATLVGAITGLILALNQIGIFNSSNRGMNQGSLIEINREKNKNTEVFAELGRITIISDQMGKLRSVGEFLKENGAAEIAVVGSQDLQELSISHPDIVIVGSDTRHIWQEHSKTILAQMFENSKLIGIGEGGTSLFNQLGLELGGVMHGQISFVEVEVTEILHEPFPLETDENLVEVYQPNPSYVVGVYDHGSFELSGFEGIARWEDHKNHWPIARQGNYVLWGFEANTEFMTENGRRLFVNLISNLKAQPSIPLSEAIKKPGYVKQGQIRDVLTSQFTDHSWEFQVNEPGIIEAHLNWEPKERPLALILNGPGKVDYYARKEGVSELLIEFGVNEEIIAKGSNWRISVVCFEHLGNTEVNYNLALYFPQ